MSDETQEPEVDAQQLWDEEATARESGEPAAETAPEPTDQGPEAEPEPEVDPLAELRDQVKTLSSQLGTVTSDLKSAQGRIAAWQREQAEAAKKAAKAVEEAPSAGQMAAAVANPESWNKLKEEFPDWATATEHFVEGKLNAVKLPPQDSGAIEALKSEVVGLQSSVNRTLAELHVAIAHRGWQQTVKTEDFKTWYGAQPREVQALGASDAPDDAIRMLDLFEASRKTAVQERNRADALKVKREGNLANAAATPRGVKAVRTDTVDLDNMSPEQLWQYEAKLREKKRAESSL